MPPVKPPPAKPAPAKAPLVKPPAKDVVPMSKTRVEIKKHMKGQTLKVADKVLSILVKGYSQEVLRVYDVGEILADVRQNRGAVYGDDGEVSIRQIAAYVGLQEKTAGTYVAIAQTFDRDFVEAWSAKPMPTGGTLRVTHWAVLSQLVKEKDRGDLLKKAVEKGMTVDEVVVAASKLGKRNDPRGIRGPARPRSVVQEIAVIGKLAVKLTKYRHNVETFLLKNLKATPVEGVALERVTELRKVLEELRRFVDETDVGLEAWARAADPDDEEPAEAAEDEAAAEGEGTGETYETGGDGDEPAAASEDDLAGGDDPPPAEDDDVGPQGKD